MQEELKRIKDHGVFEVVDKAKVQEAGHKIITSTWSMKKKASGVYRARMVARGFEQVDGKHYDSQTKGSSVVSHMMVMVLLVLTVMGLYVARLKDVNGAFLLGNFERGESIHMEIPQGFQQ